MESIRLARCAAIFIPMTERGLRMHSTMCALQANRALRIPPAQPCRRSALFRDEASLGVDESGSPLLLQGMLIDITKDKLVEEELRQHRRNLEKTGGHAHDSALSSSPQCSILPTPISQPSLAHGTQAGSALKKHADQLEDLFQNAPCGYHLLDPDGVFIRINDTGAQLAWAAHAKRSREKCASPILLTPANEKIFLACYQNLKECGRICNLEIDQIACMDGTCLSVLLNANAIKDADGRFLMSRLQCLTLRIMRSCRCERPCCVAHEYLHALPGQPARRRSSG